jgi:uncharacterized Zn finger protein (UPF0148 family)
MFDDIIGQLQGLDAGMSIPIQLELDEAGYLDRKCHDEQCGTDFKVLFEDWRDKVRDDAVYCPICRHQADSTEWNNAAQEEQINAEALRYLHGQLNTTFSDAARRFNRSQPRGSMINVSISYRPGSPPVVVPASASDLLRQKFDCEQCHCRYSSLGAAFFCPACGHNNAGSTFDATVDTVRKTLIALPEIRQSVCAATDADTAENSARHICENGLVKLVSSFQRFAEALFDRVPNRAQFTPRRNLFQSLRESDDVWRAAIGVGYSDLVSGPDYSLLEVYFQQRHLLAHKDGIVDQDYLDRWSDARYVLGQRLVVRPESVSELAGLTERLVQDMRKQA